MFLLYFDLYNLDSRLGYDKMDAPAALWSIYLFQLHALNDLPAESNQI